MPVLAALERQLQGTRPLDGARVAASGRLTKERAYLLYVLKRAGARLLVADDPEPSHERDGIQRALGAVDYYDPGEPALDVLAGFHPHLLLDNGRLSVEAVSHRAQLGEIVGGTLHSRNAEMVVRRAIAGGQTPGFPLVGVASCPLKEQIETWHGTGQSTVAAIVTATRRQLAGTVVVVVGYGANGRGLASYLRAAHARVVVVERSATAGVLAVYDGMQLAQLETALPIADFVITATGEGDVIRDEHLDLLKDGCVLGNAGRRDGEIRVDDLKARASITRDCGGGVVEYVLSNRRILLLADGRQVNHHCGEGNASDVMDLSLALHVLCLQTLWESPQRYHAGIASVDPADAERVAQIKLHTLGLATSSVGR
ncbi:MAG TPA: NAD(P)-dependent oxidoreductase [Conexibacter sp.]|nr:NAD(P)-dependent oxidoreductase [Conexibacter sp.]